MNKKPEEELRKIIREEVEKVMHSGEYGLGGYIQDTDPLMGNQNDVENIRNEIDELWKEIQTLQQKEVDDHIKRIIKEIESMQLPWDVSAEMRNRLLDIQDKFNDVIRELKNYPSQFNQLLQKAEESDTF